MSTTQVAPGLGKIGVLVALESDAPADTLTTLGKQIAMHVAAANPLALTARRARCRARSSASARSRWKRRRKAASRQNIVEKMVEGGLGKFRKDNALLSQLFVMDNKTPVADVVAAAGEGCRRRRFS